MDSLMPESNARLNQSQRAATITRCAFRLHTSGSLVAASTGAACISEGTLSEVAGSTNFLIPIKLNPTKLTYNMLNLINFWLAMHLYHEMLSHVIMLCHISCLNLTAVDLVSSN